MLIFFFSIFIITLIALRINNKQSSVRAQAVAASNPQATRLHIQNTKLKSNFPFCKRASSQLKFYIETPTLLPKYCHVQYQI